MLDTAGFKQTLKDASDSEAIALFVWAKACMEVRGLIEIEGAARTLKRRSDAGQQRSGATVESVRERIQPTLSGIPGDK